MSLNKKRKRLRIVNPAYPAFNIYSSIAKKTTALGPVCAATAVQKMEGWDVEVIDENNMRRFGPKKIGERGADHELLQKIRPADIVGIYGGLTSTIPRLYEIAKFYKEKGLPVIAAGQHFVEETIPEAFDNGIDYIVIGEGEKAIKELLNALVQKGGLDEVKGIVYKRNGDIIKTPCRDAITDFEEYPLPDFSLVRYAKIKIYPVERIRGCGMKCEFCTVRGVPRPSSPERIMENISRIVETYGARDFFIVDDLFGQYRDETIRFCGLLSSYQDKINKRLDITVQIRLDKAKDTELLQAMRDAGIYTVAIGFESPIEEELQVMNKKIKPDEMIRLARIYNKFGFLVHGMFIFGYPIGAVSPQIPLDEKVKRYREFIKKAKIDTIQVLLPVPLPGTELRQRLLDEKRIYSKEEIGWEYYDGNFPLFEPEPPFTAKQLQDASRKIMGGFYRFRYMFSIGIYICSFPRLLFFLHNIRIGWERWYRSWRNSLIRFGGWMIIKGWGKEFKKSDFSEKLQNAQKNLRK